VHHLRQMMCETGFWHDWLTAIKYRRHCEQVPPKYSLIIVGLASILFEERSPKMPEQLRVGVIGASWYSDLRHLPALKSHPRAQTVAVCDIDRDRAEEMARKYDIPLVSNDYREVIDKGDLDALLVVTPDDTHHAITMAALDAGLHVLCEKPLAHNAQQAREMYDRAETAGVKHMTFFTWRWPPHYRYLKELIDEGYVGRCFDCHICLLTGNGRRGEYSWRYDRAHGNGVLSEYGAHMIDLARWLVGDVARVNAHLRMFLDRPGAGGGVLDPTNDSAMLAIEFVNGTQGVMQLSSLAYIGTCGMDQRITLHGESGTLEASTTFRSAEIRGARASGSGELEARDTYASTEIRGERDGEEGFRLLPIPDRVLAGVDEANPYHVISQFQGTYLFIDSILADRPVSPSFLDGLKAQEVIDAAKESHERGCWVSLQS
jgi:predicted dehydrogenase